MTAVQKAIKYAAMAFAVLLIVSIVGGIVSAVFGIFGGFLTNDAVTDEVKTYSVSSDITALEIDINAADFTVKQADRFLVESNLKNLTVTEENGILTLKDHKKFSGNYNGAILTLYIPSDTVFEKAEIATGAGRVTVDTLSAKKLKLSLGAGEVNIGFLSATVSADIDGGAGKLTIAAGTLTDLDLDMGVGQLNLTSALFGNCELDLGVGESNITLIGSNADYALNLEKGIGNITVDGKSLSEYKSSASAKNRVDIDGGIGAIHLNFNEN